jgi:hypothetical protein
LVCIQLQTIANAWIVEGFIPDDNTNTNCMVSSNYKDGSRIEFRKDLIDGEMYFWIRNTDWELVADQDDKEKIRVNFMRNKYRMINGDYLNWHIINKNTIFVVSMKEAVLTKVLWETEFIRFIMPGNAANLLIDFPGRAAIKAIRECMDAYKLVPVPDVSGPVNSFKPAKKKDTI